MGRPDASAERMVAVTKRYGLSVVLVLSALLVILLVRPETLVGPVFLPAVCSAPGSAGWGPAWSQTDHRLFFLPGKYALRFDPAEPPEPLISFSCVGSGC